MQGNFICVSSPPTCLPQTFSFPERTAATKPVGVVLATPAASDQQLVFSISRVWGYNAKPQWGAPVGINASYYNNGTFSINSCSGVITVVQDWKLDSKYVQNFTVEVQIRPDGETYGSILVNMTLNMIGESSSRSSLQLQRSCVTPNMSMRRNSQATRDSLAAILQCYRVHARV